MKYSTEQTRRFVIGPSLSVHRSVCSDREELSVSNTESGVSGMRRKTVIYIDTR